jgi:hypothetical protein
MNPASTTQIKCDLWAGTISPSIPLNAGQGRGDFQVVMAGSNAYVKDIVGNKIPTVPIGYNIEAYAHGAAIEAPRDCNGQETYMGVAYWRDGRLDINRCIASCQRAGLGDVQGRTCRFVNTYIQRRNGVPTSQHCAMYSQYWPIEYVTPFPPSILVSELVADMAPGMPPTTASPAVPATSPSPTQTRSVSATSPATTLPAFPVASAPAPVARKAPPSSP